jgi:malate dehydrogenase (oxaloacetate-decarboxylating)(NADP+)
MSSSPNGQNMQGHAQDQGARPGLSEQDALRFHSEGRPGKLEIALTKPLSTQRDLGLAYSPGVAAPVLAIAEDETRAFDYTTKGNSVAIVTNGSAILGLGNRGALAAKPVMEGQAMLFKRFADIDAIDIEIASDNPDEIIHCVRLLAKSWGGITLSDIKAPDCFVVERTLRETLDIPIFHDDQHGAAIIVAAGLLNALELTGRRIKETRVVCNGAGAAGIACCEVLRAIGIAPENLILCDTKGTIHEGRSEGMNEWKAPYAIKTQARNLADALRGADVLIGLSVKGVVSPDMVKSMAAKPIIFAMANPDPEISPEDVRRVRDDAIIATGRSDYPNQINNVLGFPYVMRGALDVRATTINMEMKIAAAKALAALAREDVPDAVALAYGKRPRFGPDYIIPTPFDPRLILRVPQAVAQAAMESGVARKPVADRETYELQLRARRDPTTNVLGRIFQRLRRSGKRVIFSEGEEERVIRAATAFVDDDLGTIFLVGREERVHDNARRIGITLDERIRDGKIRIVNAASSTRNDDYAAYLHQRLERKGHTVRDCQKLVQNDRDYFAACMLALGEADGMVTGLTHHYSITLENIRRCIDPKPGHKLIGVSLVLAPDGRMVIVADTAVTEMPYAADLADIAVEVAGVARRLGHEPRLAMLAFSTFGHPPGHRSAQVQEAVRLLDQRQVDFEYDGEMGADVALNPAISRRLSVQPPDRSRQCAGDAGIPFRRHLHQNVARTRRRNRDRSLIGWAGQVGADRSIERSGFQSR